MGKQLNFHADIRTKRSFKTQPSWNYGLVFSLFTVGFFESSPPFCTSPIHARNHTHLQHTKVPHLITSAAQLHHISRFSSCCATHVHFENLRIRSGSRGGRQTALRLYYKSGTKIENKWVGGGICVFTCRNSRKTVRLRAVAAETGPATPPILQRCTAAAKTIEQQVPSRPCHLIKILPKTENDGPKFKFKRAWAESSLLRGNGSSYGHIPVRTPPFRNA